jgi:sugar phosphate isomerase/epimerase
VSHVSFAQSTSQPESDPALLGVQLYSVRDDIGPGQLSGTLRRLAGLGFTHVEPYRILDDTGGLAAALRETGLSAVAAHANVVAAGQGDRDGYIAAARQLGLSTLIVPWAEPSRLADRDGINALADAINSAARRGADEGIAIGYHNHDFEFRQRVSGTAAYEILADALDDGVVLELDTHWASVGGADVFELIPRLGSRIGFLHVTNEPPDDDDPPVLGVDITGRMDEVVAAGQKAGAMTVLEVVVHDGDVFPALERNAAYFLELVRQAPQPHQVPQVPQVQQ